MAPVALVESIFNSLEQENYNFVLYETGKRLAKGQKGLRTSKLVIHFYS